MALNQNPYGPNDLKRSQFFPEYIMFLKKKMISLIRKLIEKLEYAFYSMLRANQISITI